MLNNIKIDKAFYLLSLRIPHFFYYYDPILKSKLNKLESNNMLFLDSPKTEEISLAI